MLILNLIDIVSGEWVDTNMIEFRLAMPLDLTLDIPESTQILFQSWTDGPRETMVPPTTRLSFVVSRNQMRRELLSS